MKGNPEDTICAISTPIGHGAIGIVRLSGPGAIPIAGGIFQSADQLALADLESHRLKYGHVVDGDLVVDEVLAAVMRAPASYTREDVVEIHCHGGPAALRSVLELVRARGARPAEPGEFTRRAFLHGRIDLTQAGAVLEVIRSRTRASLRSAAARLSGELGERVRAATAALVEALAHLEASIDFPDEDLPDLSAALLAETHSTSERIQGLLACSESGILYQEGITVALTGRPNVGKSSLFNRLVRSARAIVTAEPGTTRDVIEETITLDGVPVRLLDSAGLRPANDAPEQQGVEHARRALGRADLILVVFDSSQTWSAEDEGMIHEVASLQGARLGVLNKSDQPTAMDPDHVHEKLGAPPVSTSALTGEGITTLERTISERVLHAGLLPPESALVTNLREVDCLERARDRIAAFQSAVGKGIPLDVAGLDLREAVSALGELTGEVTSDELLDRIFSEFCIGK